MDTKNKLQKINLAKVSNTETIEIPDSGDYLIHFDTDENRELEMISKRINLKFLEENLTSDVYIRIVLDTPIKLNLEVALLAKQGIKGISSKLDMRALMLNPNAVVTFVPILEIDEMDVSVDHKSTIGSPPKTWVDFMKSRGLDENSINKIVREAFVSI